MKKNIYLVEIKGTTDTAYVFNIYKIKNKGKKFIEKKSANDIGSIISYMYYYYFHKYCCLNKDIEIYFDGEPIRPWKN